MSYFKTIWGDYFFSFLVLLIGLTASVAASITYKDNRNDQVVQRFQAVAADRIELIRVQLERNDAIISSLASFFEASEDVTYDEFVHFSRTLIENTPYIAGALWIPVVSEKDRKHYEASVDYFISEQGENGELIRAKKRPYYLPISYSEPLHSATFLGFDYNSEPLRAFLLEQARISRKTVASEKVALLRTGESAILFAHPIFAGESSEDVRGYVMTAVPLEKLIATAIHPLNAEGVNIIIQDNSATNAKGEVIFTRSTRLKKIDETEIINDFHSETQLRDSALLNIAGRQWEITVLATRGYFVTGMPMTSYAILGAGIVFTLMLFVFMFSRIQENQRISKRVTERTREIQQAKSKIETILFSTYDGIIGLDKGGKITFCNPQAAQMLGYNKRVLLGADYISLVAHSKEDGTPYLKGETEVSIVLRSGEPVTVSDKVLWKSNGEMLPAEFTISPILDNSEVEGLVVTFRDVTMRRDLERKLEKLARYDQLTGLANRSLFVDQLKKAVARAKRTDKKIGMVYIDLNNFKPINDTLGHDAGDQILRSFADRLNKSSREYDMPARLGGDEFVVMIDNLDSYDGCIRFVERLLTNLREPVQIAGQDIVMSGSMGVAFYPDDAADPDELIKTADEAMYKAKKNKALPYALHKSRL